MVNPVILGGRNNCYLHIDVVNVNVALIYLTVVDITIILRWHIINYIGVWVVKNILLLDIFFIICNVANFLS